MREVKKGMLQPLGTMSVQPWRFGSGLVLRWNDWVECGVDEPMDEADVGFTERWMRRTGIRSSETVGFSDVPGTMFCSLRASSSFFVNLGISIEARVLWFQISLHAKEAVGKHSQGLQMVGSSSCAI